MLPVAGDNGVVLVTMGEDASNGRPAIVGRTDELAQLDECVEQARAGRSLLVSLGGEPGIGKSYLADEVRRRAAAAGMITLNGVCLDNDGVVPYLPWIQILRAAVRARGPALIEQIAPIQAAALAQLVPEVVRLSLRLPVLAEQEPRAERHRLFDAVSLLIGVLAQEAPTALFLDDVHWADLTSLALLQHVVAQAVQLPVLFVLCYRHDDVGRRRAIRELVEDLERTPGAVRRKRAGLDEAGCAGVIPAARRGRVDAAEVREIYEVTDGNPFYVLQLARDRSARGDGTKALCAQGVFVDRFERLGADCQAVLSVAAVIGAEIGGALLVRVVREGSSRRSPSATLDALARAVDAGLIERTGDGTSFRFPHALIREAIYEHLPGPERLRLHRAVGRALETLHAGDLDPHLDTIARHYYEGALDGGVQEAVRYLRRAGAKAYKLAAFGEATRAFEQALQVLDFADEPNDAARCELLVSLGEASFFAGDVRCLEHFKSALSLARHVGNPMLFARAVVGSHGVWGVAGATSYEYVALLEEALDWLGPEDCELRVLLLGRLETELYWSPKRERSEELGRELLAMGRRLGTPSTLARTLNAAHFALWRPDNAEERLALAQENVALGELTGDQYMIAGGLVWRIIDQVEIGRMLDARADIEAYRVVAKRLGSPFFRWQLAVLDSLCALIDGRYDEAEGLIHAAHQIGSNVGDANADLFLGVQLTQLFWHRGRLGELEDGVRGLIAASPGIPAWRGTLALIHAEQGDLERAHRELEGLTSGDLASVPQDANFLITMALLAETCRLVGDAERAQRIYEHLRPSAGRAVVVGNGAACFGAVSYFLGGLASAFGDIALAREHYADALTAHLGWGAPGLAAMARMGLADIRRRAGDDDKASALAREVLAVARDLGMPRLQERAEADLAAVASRTDETVPSMRDEVWSFRRDGDSWAIGRAPSTFRLRHSKGLACLAFLLERPGEQLLALDLAAAVELPQSANSDAPRRAEGATTRNLGDAGEMLDLAATSAYKRRLSELREELEEAEAMHDLGRADRAREETEFLAHELARAVGLGGRSRKAAAHSERARLNVTRTIKAAIRKIAAHDGAIGHHLERAVRTGRVCSYSPDPLLPIRWRLHRTDR